MTARGLRWFTATTAVLAVSLMIPGVIFGIAPLAGVGAVSGFLCWIVSLTCKPAPGRRS